MFWILTLTFAYAADKTPEALKPMVWTNGYYDGDIKRVFPADQYRYADRARFDQESRAWGYLMPSQRDAILKKLKLEAKLKTYDQLDKDMLVMDARFYSLKDLRKFHPKLPARDLAALKEAVKGAK